MTYTNLRLSEERIEEIETAFKARLFDLIGTKDLIESAVKWIAEIFDSQMVAYNVISEDLMIVGIYSYPSLETFDPKLLNNVNAYLHQHPCWSHFANRQVRSDPALISELEPESSFRKTDLYQKAYRLMGFEYQMNSGLWDESDSLHLLTNNRSEGDFTENERTLFHRMYIDFIKALRCNYLISARLNEIHRTDGLTSREAEVLQCLADGSKNPQIANELSISERTVEKHCQNMCAKLGFENRNQLVNYASRTRTLRFPQLR